VLGDPSDVQTIPGTYDGYEVRFGCEPNYHGFSVVFVEGLGTTPFPQFGGKGAPEGPQLEAQFWRLAERAREIASTSTVHGVAAVHPCVTHGWAIGLLIHDYREVDDVVPRIGAWLATESLQGEVVLWMQRAPVPGDAKPLAAPFTP
jgi:hypothetical protein